MLTSPARLTSRSSSTARTRTGCTLIGARSVVCMGSGSASPMKRDQSIVSEVESASVGSSEKAETSAARRVLGEPASAS